MRPRLSFDQCLLGLSLLGLLVLLYIGAASYSSALPGHHYIDKARTGGEAWLEKIHRILLTKGEKEIVSGADAGSVVLHKESAYPGYALFTNHRNYDVTLIDMDGTVVHRWSIPFSKAWPHPKHVSFPVPPDKQIFFIWAQAYPNGDLLGVYQTLVDTPYGYGLIKADKDSNILWTYAGNVHHELYVAQNGNIYALSQRFVRQPMTGFEFLRYPALEDVIVILSPEGKELAQIPLLEAFAGTPFAAELHNPAVLQDPKNDYLHANSVMKLEDDIAPHFPMFKAGQILLSFRTLNMIAVLDPDTRKIIWAQQGRWRVQHHATFLPNGHIMLYDNLGGRQQGVRQSRLIEFDPKDNSVPWSYGGFYSRVHGNYQLLPNGNIFIVETTQARLFEITPSGEIVWDFRLPLSPGVDSDQATNVNNRLQNSIEGGRRYGPDDLTFLK